MSHRELEILALIAENHSNQEIANSLFLTLGIVKWYSRQIFSKLGVNKRQKAVDRAIQLGYLKEREKTFVAYRGSAPRHNLPSLLPTFFGRDQEQEELIQLLSEYRLVTLVGTGGIGKTTLSLHLAQKLKRKYPDGVWFVELAPLGDPKLIPQAVMTALGISDQPNISQTIGLRDVLRKKAALILLDNCEHLLDACAELTNVLLNHCPDLRILATSREPLRVPGEALFNVLPLAFPDVSVEELIGKMQESPAVRLFLDRARLVDGHFSLSAANTLFILQICNQLNGLPLALELAAARVNVLSVEQITTRLKENFSLLTQGSRTVLPRHQTLRTSLEWSWDLLSEQERVLLRRLSVFAGGWTLGAAEAVCGDGGIASTDILNLLSQLVSKSLVHVQQKLEQDVRYHLLEIIRQYAQEQLSKANETEEFRQRHLDYYLQLAQQAEQELEGPNQAVWLDHLERDMDNIRTALTCSQETNVEAGIHITRALFLFSWARGNGSAREMETWLADAMRKKATMPPLVKAKALLTQGRYIRIFSRQKDLPGLLEESAALYRALDDQAGIAEALTLMGDALIEQSEFDRAEQLLQESLAISRKTQDKMQAAAALRMLGLLKRRINYQEARTLLEESSSIYRELGNFARLGVNLTDLGQLAMYQGDFKAARPLIEEGLALQEQMNFKGMPFSLHHLGTLYYCLGEYSAAQVTLEKAISSAQQSGITNDWALVQLGYTCLRLGEFTQARQMFVESQARFSLSNTPVGVIYSLEGLTSLAVHQGHLENVARLFGWADSMRQSIGDLRPPVEQEEVDTDITAIIEQIGKDAFASAYEDGKTLTMDEAIALALEE